MKSIFVGNLDFDARQSDVDRLFRRYGKVERVDMKSGFAFVYMEDERDADDAIRRLDQMEFGRKRRRIRVEWTKQERGGRRPSPRRSSANTKPSKSLFVINFDPVSTRTRDIERHFEPYGIISNVRIRKNFAFVQFENQEDATRALEETNMSKFMDRVITVEYAIRDDDDRGNGHNPDRRGRDMLSPDRRGRDVLSPDRRGRDVLSPDRRGRDVLSPDRRGRDVLSPDRRGRDVLSPDRRGYGRGRSPSPYSKRYRGSPDYGRGSDPTSRGGPRRSPDYGRPESPANERYYSRSPPPRERSRSRS